MNQSKMAIDTEPSKATAPIHKLNDDCLLSIFDYLPERDLVSLTLVSKDFNRIANEVRFEKREVELQRFSWLFLRRFGGSIRSLELNFNVYTEAIEEICKLCPNLTALTCFNLYTEVFLSPVFSQLLSRLTKLSIIRLWPSHADCHIDDALGGFEELTQLSLGEELPWKVKYQSNFEPFFRVKFPKLRDFNIRLASSSSNALLDEFLQLNSSIKTMSIETDEGDMTDDSSYVESDDYSYYEESFFGFDSAGWFESDSDSEFYDDSLDYISGSESDDGEGVEPDGEGETDYEEAE